MTSGIVRGARLPRVAGRNVFGSDVAAYHTARAAYPDALYRLIAARAPGFAAIGEIGPGTGLATSALAMFDPTRFVAFEPDPLLAAHLRTRFPKLDVVDEDFCSADVAGGFDLIGAASSFHWLDPDLALPRLRALLRPGGCLALWWNVYRATGIGDPFAEAVAPLLEGLELPPSEAADRHYALDEDMHRASLAAAGFQHIDYQVFRCERVLTPEQARALYASFSLVRLLVPERKELLLDAIAALVADRFGGAVTSTILTPIYLANTPLA